MIHDRTPDAIRSPLSFAGAGDSHHKLEKLKAEFARVLKVTRVFVRHQGGEHFISGSADDTLNFHSHDTRSGLPRHDWENRGDGVLYGYHKPDVSTD